MENHFFKGHLSILEYANRKNVSKTAVENRIRKGDISPVLIGAGLYRFIDWEAYKDIAFNESMKRHKSKKNEAE